MSHDDELPFFTVVNVTMLLETRKAKSLSDPIVIQQCLTVCEELLHESVSQLLEKTFVALDDALLSLAGKAGDNNFKHSDYDLLRYVYLRWSDIEQACLKKTESHWEDFWLHHHQALTQEKQLVLSSDNPEYCLLSDLHVSDTSRLHDELALLHQRFEALSHLDRIKQLPVTPFVIAYLLDELLTDSGFSSEARSVVLLLFNDHAIPILEVLYTKQNEALSDEGILPDLVIKQARLAKASRQIHQDIWHDVSFSRIQKKLTAQFISVSDADVFNKKTILRGLCELQDRDLAEASFDKPALDLPQTLDLEQVLFHQLTLRATETSDKQLPEKVVLSCHVIGLLFVQLIKNPLLPEEIKRLLLRLRFPFLKLAITDDSFFLHHMHPARQFINNIGLSVIGWSMDKDYVNNNLYRRIEIMVGKVLMRFTYRASVFRKLNVEFNNFLEIDRRGIQMAQQRTIQALCGQARLKQMKVLVDLEVEQRLAGVSGLPDIIQVILSDIWTNVLLLIVINQGVDSLKWVDAIGLMDSLIWSVNPETLLHERKKLIDDMPYIVGQLREGLEEIKFDPEKMEQALKLLQKAHIDIIRGSANAICRSEFPILDRVEASGVQPTHLTRAELEVNQLQLNDWMDIIKNKTSSKRVKLCWKGDGLFLFVNRKGIKALEIEQKKLIKLFKLRRVQVLKHIHQPVLDRALETLLSDLNI